MRAPGRNLSSRGSLAALATVLVLVTVSAQTVPVPEEERIAKVLGLREGMVVADVGAGDGRWSEALAARLGPAGRVLATEVEPGKVEKLRELTPGPGSARIEAVLGSQSDTGLSPGCCDAVLLRMTYHHFKEPGRMRRSLWRSLRPGGLIAVIDIHPQEHWRRLPGTPDRGGHGIEPAILEQEMTGDGFVVERRIGRWQGDPERYCLLFRRPAGKPEGVGRVPRSGLRDPGSPLAPRSGA
jgi:ubiquinone/menaquinone biosynthesis C-methylase UbiE